MLVLKITSDLPGEARTVMMTKKSPMKKVPRNLHAGGALTTTSVNAELGDRRLQAQIAMSTGLGSTSAVRCECCELAVKPLAEGSCASSTFGGGTRQHHR